MLAAAFRYGRPPSSAGAPAPVSCGNALAPLVRLDPQGGKDNVLPGCRFLVAPSGSNVCPRLRCVVLPLQHLPRCGEHGSGAYSCGIGGLCHVVRFLSKHGEGGGIVKIAFAQGDMVVVARFLEGKAVSLNFTQFNDKDEEVPFTTEELDALLGAYGSREDWQTVYEHEIKGTMLINASKKLIANVGGNLGSLMITSKTFAEAGINKGREKPVKAPEGFW